MRKVFLLPLFLIAGLAVSALALVAATSHSATRDVERRIQEVRRANALAHRLAHLTAKQEQEVLALRFRTAPERVEGIAAAESRAAEMSAITDELGQLELPPRGRALWHEVVAAQVLRARERRGLVAALDAADPDALALAYARWDLVTGRTSALVADLSVFNLRRLESALEEVERIGARSVELLVGVLGASALVVLAFSLFVNRFLVRPVQAMTAAARRIATERLAIPVPGGHRKDELGVLARAMTRTAGDLVRANAQLARSVSTRDEFLSIASHELKTPLTVLKLQLQNAARRFEQNGGAPPPPWVAAALRQLARVEALVAELLDLARIRSGRLTLHTGRVDLAELARSAADRLREVLARTGNALELELPERLELECDAGRVDQVLANLLGNAAQHAPGTRVLVQARREADRAILSVEDEGPGIPESARERVFEPYEKVDREQRGAGLGLGLHIARQIVEAHGGSIRVATGHRGGALVTVEIPAAAERERAPRPGGAAHGAP